MHPHYKYIEIQFNNEYYCHVWGVRDCRRNMDWMLDLLTACIHQSELHFTDHWHTQTSVLSPLQSPLSVSWQRLLTMEILQLPALRSSCHSHPCRTLVNWQLNYLVPRLAAISHQPPSLHKPTSSWQLTTDNWTLSLTNQLLHGSGILSFLWNILVFSFGSYFILDTCTQFQFPSNSIKYTSPKLRK
jgi:hypothetical protein